MLAFVAVPGLLTVVAGPRFRLEGVRRCSLRALAHRLSGCGAWT